MEQAPKREKPEERSSLRRATAFISDLTWFTSAALALLAFFLVKRYVIDIEKVNASDMLDTYAPGDALLVKKTRTTFVTGDVVCFEMPDVDSAARRTIAFQRILGMPGDCVMISEKQPFVNRLAIYDTSTVKHNYFVKAAQKLDSLFLAQNDLTEGGEVSNAFDYAFSLTKRQAHLLRSNPLIKSVEEKMEKRGAADAAGFPGVAAFPWNRDHFGPLYIPREGDTLTLDTVNIHLYAQLIRQHERNHLELRGDTIRINGVTTKRYGVKKNYYFVLGDNRDNALDSRAWGYLPANQVLGIASRRIASP